MFWVTVDNIRIKEKYGRGERVQRGKPPNDSSSKTLEEIVISIFRIPFLKRILQIHNGCMINSVCA